MTLSLVTITLMMGAGARHLMNVSCILKLKA